MCFLIHSLHFFFLWCVCLWSCLGKRLEPRAATHAHTSSWCRDKPSTPCLLMAVKAVIGRGLFRWWMRKTVTQLKVETEYSSWPWKLQFSHHKVHLKAGSQPIWVFELWANFTLCSCFQSLLFVLKGNKLFHLLFHLPFQKQCYSWLNSSVISPHSFSLAAIVALSHLHSSHSLSYILKHVAIRHWWSASLYLPSGALHCLWVSPIGYYLVSMATTGRNAMATLTAGLQKQPGTYLVWQGEWQEGAYVSGSGFWYRLWRLGG